MTTFELFPFISSMARPVFKARVTITESEGAKRFWGVETKVLSCIDQRGGYWEF